MEMVMVTVSKVMASKEMDNIPHRKNNKDSASMDKVREARLCIPDILDSNNYRNNRRSNHYNLSMNMISFFCLNVSKQELFDHGLIPFWVCAIFSFFWVKCFVFWLFLAFQSFFF